MTVPSAAALEVGEPAPDFSLPSTTGREVSLSHIERGGLASSAANLYQPGRHGARLVDRIIRVARPADLPVEEETTFELVINLRTARAQGLAISPSPRLRADRLIE